MEGKILAQPTTAATQEAVENAMEVLADTLEEIAGSLSIIALYVQRQGMKDGILTAADFADEEKDEPAKAN
jgi:hypothetical protein